jgi:hypothetical protein
MRARTRGALATIARSVAVFVAIVVGAAAIRALAGALLWGEWFIGAGLAALIGAWLATMPGGSPKADGGSYYGYGGVGGYGGDGGDGRGGFGHRHRSIER